MARFNRYIRILCLCLALACLFGCTQRPSGNVPAETNTAEITVTPAIPETPIAAPESPQASPEVSSSPEATPTPEVNPPAAPKYPDLMEQPEIGDEFFADAAFLGNSLIDGFRLFSGMNLCDYYCATSMTVSGAGDLIDKMAQKQYAKVYILLGINEIGYDVDYFAGLYQKMLEDIMAKQPEAEIYIMGITPVSKAKSDGSDTFNMDRVKLYNEALHQLAEDNECWYVDLCEGLAGDDGYLPANVTSDGVHFNASHYKVWLNYLRTHYNPVV